MVQIIIRIVINAIALWVAAWVLGDRLGLTDSIGELVLVAVVFGLVNAFIKPIIQLLSCPLTMVTLGLFTLVINALMLMLTGWLTGGAVSPANFGWALVAALIISVVSTVLNAVLTDKD